MQLPFTHEQFYDVFREYNQTLWPAPLLLMGLAIFAIVLVLRPRSWSGTAISGILALLWAWLALAYHLAFFAEINPLAYLFSAMSLLGALALFWQGVVYHRLRFAWLGGGRAYAGAVLIVFALIVYPLWSWYAGYGYPSMPTFGLPCPTTIFTIGILAFMISEYPRSVLVVPVLWCLVGAQAAFVLGVAQDMGLIVAGVVGVVLLIKAKKPMAPVRSQ
jgi:hypothetical protein